MKNIRLSPTPMPETHQPAPPASLDQAAVAVVPHGDESCPHAALARSHARAAAMPQRSLCPHVGHGLDLMGLVNRIQMNRSHVDAPRTVPACRVPCRKEEIEALQLALCVCCLAPPIPSLQAAANILAPKDLTRLAGRENGAIQNSAGAAIGVEHPVRSCRTRMSHLPVLRRPNPRVRHENSKDRL